MFLLQFRNYFKLIWQGLENAPTANLKKSDYNRRVGRKRARRSQSSYVIFSIII